MTTRVEAGKVYGALTVLSIEGRNRHSRQLAKCLCSCGVVKIIDGGNIAAGKSRSCGHLKGSKKPDGEAQLSTIFKRYKRQALERGIAFCLSRTEFKEIIVKPCHYCGAPPHFTKKNGLSTGLFVTGVDRVDSSNGYIDGNCVPCCINCNRAKSDWTLEQFKEWAARLYLKTVQNT